MERGREKGGGGFNSLILGREKEMKAMPPTVQLLLWLFDQCDSPTNRAHLQLLHCSTVVPEAAFRG